MLTTWQRRLNQDWGKSKRITNISWNKPLAKVTFCIPRMPALSCPHVDTAFNTHPTHEIKSQHYHWKHQSSQQTITSFFVVWLTVTRMKVKVTIKNIKIDWTLFASKLTLMMPKIWCWNTMLRYFCKQRLSLENENNGNRRSTKKCKHSLEKLFSKGFYLSII